MFGFIKRMLIASIRFIGLIGYNSMECVSMGNKQCQVKPAIGNISGNEPLFISYNDNFNKCSGSC